MKLPVLYAVAVIALITPSSGLGIDVSAPLDLSKVDFGSARELVQKAYRGFVDHETDTGSAIRSDKLEWHGVQVGCIIWFDDRDTLKSILFTIPPNAKGGVKTSFDKLSEEFLETHGKPSTKDVRDSGYTRFVWDLQSSSVSFAFIPASGRIAEHAFLSYRAPTTTEAEQGEDDQATAVPKSKP